MRGAGEEEKTLVYLQDHLHVGLDEMGEEDSSHWGTTKIGMDT